MRNGNIIEKLISNRNKRLVLILPMRNGNRYFLFLLFFVSFVLILPMRNGNPKKYDEVVYGLEFLSYL